MVEKSDKSELLKNVEEIIMIVRHIVDHPNEVRVDVRGGAIRMTAELYTCDDDVAQVIGKNGHLITSLRALVQAFSGKHGIKVDLDYVTEYQLRNR